MASDNYNRANEDPLSQGGNWAAWDSFQNLAVVSNACKNTVAAEGGSRRTDVTTERSRCKISTIGNSDGGPAINCASGAANGYFVTGANVGGRYDIMMISGGSFSSLGNVSGSYSVNDIFDLRRTFAGAGGNDMVLSKNDVDILTVNDGTFKGTGFPGMFIFDTTLILDDWSDGPVAGGPAERGPSRGKRYMGWTA